MSGSSQSAERPAARVSSLAELAWSLNGIERRLTAGLSVVLSEEGVSLDQWRILDVIGRLGSPTMGELAEATGMPNATLSRIVDSLEDAASAFRLPATADRRRITVHLSDRGEQRLDRIRAIVDAWEQATAHRLGPDAANALLDAASTVARALDD